MTTWNSIFHDMWIDLRNASRMIVAHDGGFSISNNRGRSWYRNRLPNAQMYHVTVDNQIPYYVYVGSQHVHRTANRGQS